jgi:hypothetical protein
MRAPSDSEDAIKAAIKDYKKKRASGDKSAGHIDVSMSGARVSRVAVEAGVGEAGEEGSAFTARPNRGARSPPSRLAQSIRGVRTVAQPE